MSYPVGLRVCCLLKVLIHINLFSQVASSKLMYEKQQIITRKNMTNLAKQNKTKITGY